MNINTNALYAGLTQVQDRPAQQVLRQHADAIASLVSQLVNTQGNVASQPKPLTLAQIKAALQANGTNPLVLTGLPGQAPPAQYGAHLSRPIAANTPNGTFYVETDRTAVYIVETIANAPAWVYVDGVFKAALSSRPTDLTGNDAGFLFYATDRGVTYRWTGAAWSFQTELGLAWEGAHIARVASGTLGTSGTAVTWASGDKFDLSWVDMAIVINGVAYNIASVADNQHLTLSTTAGVQVGVAYLGGYFSYQFGTGVGFYETDRTVSYITATSSGTLNTTGTAVAWVSGDKFDTNWVGATITINNVAYVIAAVASTIALTLATTAGNQAGVAFSVSGGKWLWVGGSFSRTQTQLSALTATLGVNDTGFIVPVTDYHHTLVWNGTALAFAEGDGSGHVVMGKPDGTAPNGGLWGLCDGTAYTVLKGDGTTSSVTTQNLTGNVFIKGAATTAAQRAADSPTWQAGAKTDQAVTGITVNNNTTGYSVTDNTTAVQSGAGTTVVQSTSTNDPGHNHGITEPNAGAGHDHNLSNTNAVINPPSETNHGLPLSIQCVFYMRR